MSQSTTVDLSPHVTPSHPIEREQPTYTHPTRVMLGLYLGAFAGMYSETSLNIALPQFSQHFAIPVAITQWLVVGYMLVIGIVLPLASMLMKRYTVRSIALVALGAFFIGSLMSALAPSFPIVLTGRMIQGIGTGLILPLLFAVTLRVFPPYKIGAAMGIAGLIIMFAPAVGPTLAGFLIQAFSWRAIFLSFALIVAVAFACAAAWLVNPYELTRPRIDYLSCLASVIGFGGIVLGMSLAAEFGLGSTPVMAAVLCGVLGLVYYGRRQLRSEHPTLDLGVFRYPAFSSGVTLVMANFGITLAAMFLIPLYLQNAAGLNAATAGLLLLPAGMINAVVSFAAGIAYDRFGVRVPVRCGFAISLAALIVLWYAAYTVTVPLMVCGNMLLMIGVPLAMSPAQSYALAALPGHLSADGSTVSNTLQQVVGALCTAVATLLLHAGTSYAHSTDPAEALRLGTCTAFTFTIALAALGLCLALCIERRR